MKRISPMGVGSREVIMVGHDDSDGARDGLVRAIEAAGEAGRGQA